MRLWLQRHARVLCEDGLCYGRLDVQADAAATQQAAVALAQALPPGVALRASPLRRCQALAEALQQLRPDLGPARADPRLAEMHFGAWEGHPWSAIAREDFEAWTADFAAARAGADGESTDQFVQRVAAAWDDWRATGQDAAWITHAGVMRAVQLIETGRRTVPTAADWPAEAIAFGQLWCVPRQPAFKQPAPASSA
ncbi:histidine phosphatase family protein [Xenophilus arseniciresistens]|uniref:Histidine phosphatase family protein n=1 Tax=Xenophilus arseniciresistens TaxID=1283306 RepID=A0AAE3SZQ2_9BURK|nr:histidine phosphatase family protein [Xenophilus arseniciresistens]MDA7417364.1 histidine phosphatase family protein [Xenophilus arseniciresistens]